MILSLKVFITIILSSLLKSTGVKSQENPPCYICDNDPDATISNPSAVVQLPPDLVEQFGITQLPCSTIYNAGKNGMIPVANCLASDPDADPLQALCGCSNFVAPTDAPLGVPVVAPLGVPVVAPLGVPVVAPLGVPVVAPVDVPVEAPVDVPVEAPVDVPVEAPLDTPVDGPISDCVKCESKNAKKNDEESKEPKTVKESKATKTEIEKKETKAKINNRSTEGTTAVVTGLSSSTPISTPSASSTFVGGDDTSLSSAPTKDIKTIRNLRSM
jgi:hypothetical protein